MVPAALRLSTASQSPGRLFSMMEEGMVPVTVSDTPGLSLPPLLGGQGAAGR
ncbi:hypothetical protein HMPREF0731_2325 [Pseudoroseomonas cervicalis ATCC 49957]|uniref:Uncharacterized protein n=1 Tax=Pseudoroseomonas cervicalis ATCC 49957 TaxID=525371 RepID=D5RML4_9PROT|nr:hypothetical protein HMPREF0731_2325 [Pseudoroseomonas cervicalis ATCC 49957]